MFVKIVKLLNNFVCPEGVVIFTQYISRVNTQTCKTNRSFYIAKKVNAVRLFGRPTTGHVSFSRPKFPISYP